MLIVLYFQNRIEIRSAAKRETEIHSKDRGEIRSTKSSKRKIYSTGGRNPFHEKAKRNYKNTFMRLGRNFRHTNACTRQRKIPNGGEIDPVGNLKMSICVAVCVHVRVYVLAFAC